MKLLTSIGFLLVLVSFSCATDALSISDDKTSAEEGNRKEEGSPDDETVDDKVGSPNPNILLIIADNMGLDATSQYAIENKIADKKWNLLSGNQEDLYEIARNGYFADENFMLVDGADHNRGSITVLWNLTSNG